MFKILITVVFSFFCIGHCLSGELTLLQAEKLANDAIAKAQELNIRISVAIVDQHGNLKAFKRMDHSPLISAETSRMKAFTSASAPFSTKQIADLCASDPALQALNTIPGFLLLQGGLPILFSGEHVGGIGVGGGSSLQDEECARFALRNEQ